MCELCQMDGIPGPERRVAGRNPGLRFTKEFVTWLFSTSRVASCFQ